MYGGFKKAIIAKDSFLFAAISTSVIRNLIRQADLDALEQVVLDGHGQKLIGENASDSKIRTFIKAVPSYMVNWQLFFVLSTSIKPAIIAT